MGVCANPESVISHILSHTMQGREEVWRRADRNRCLGHRLAFLTTKSCTTRQTFQKATPRQPKLGRGTAHQDKTLVGVSQGYARLCSPAFRVRHSYHLWKVAVRGTGVCSVGRPPDRPQCMGVCLKDFSVAQSYPDTHLFGIQVRPNSRVCVCRARCASLASAIA